MNTETSVCRAPQAHKAEPTPTSRSWLDMPEEAVREGRRRLLRFLPPTTLAAALLGVAWAAAAAAGLIEWRAAWGLPALAASVALLNGAVFLVGRASGVSDRAFSYVSLGHIVVVCGVLAFFHALHEMNLYGQVTAFGPYAVVIATFPVVLQPPPRLALVTGLASTASVLAGIAAAHAAGITVAGPGTFADVGSVPLVCTGIAYGVSMILTRLQIEVARARRLGSYELEEKLGEGGMGEVWRARHHLLARAAAIKLMHRRDAEAEAGTPERSVAVERFSREAQAIASLESPHTVRLYDFGVTDDRTFYFAMELLDGIDLSALVRAHGPLPPARVVAILLQVCDSLADAHDRGLIHRDVKPANIMLCRQGRACDVVKVLDFGIVGLRPRQGDGPAEITVPGAFIGTPAYMSPEAVEGVRVDERSDIYSVGCVAYWLLTGRLVFQGASAAALMAAVLRDRPAPPSSHGVDVPPDLEALVLACLEKEAARRPATIDELAARLETCPTGGTWTDAHARRWWADNAAPRKVDTPFGVPAPKTERGPVAVA